MKPDLRVLSFLIVLVACEVKNEKWKHPAKISINAFSVTKKGDTINRITENGKQGLWTYTKADGSYKDTVYKNGVPQK